MIKAEQLVSGLEKLYEKRKELDKKIGDLEKKLLSEVKSVSALAGKAAAKKTAIVNKVKTAKKLLKK